MSAEAARHRSAATEIRTCADRVAEFGEHDLARELRYLVTDLFVRAAALDDPGTPGRGRLR